MRVSLGVTALVTILLPTLALSANAPFRVVLASRNSRGVSANGQSSTEGDQVVSSDGSLVAFDSTSTNLPGGDGTTGQVYVHDFSTGKTSLVSKANSGDPAGSSVETLGMTPDGRYVTLEGNGSGLPGSDGVHSQVWLRDLKTQKTLLVSKANNGTAGNGVSDNPWVTPDGRYVEFESTSANLPGGDGTNGRIYVRDRQRGKTVLVSATSTGAPATGSEYGQVLTPDGRFATFYSTDPSLPGGDGTTEHVYRRDLSTGRTVLVDRNSGGQIANDYSRINAISADGRFVSFLSVATNLAGGDGVHQQIYLHDIRTGKTTLVSRNNAGDPQDGTAFDGRISADDRQVAFDTGASNLPGGPSYQVYLRDLRSGKTHLVSRTAAGVPGNDDSFYPSISPDAKWVAFDTTASNLGATAPHTSAVRAGPMP